MSNSRINELATHRVETRLAGNSLEINSADFTEVVYEDSTVSSLYFGSSLPEPSPAHASIRFRSRSVSPIDPHQQVMMLRSDQSGTLEIKLGDNNSHSEETTTKYLLNGYKLGEVAHILADHNLDSARKEDRPFFEQISETFDNEPIHPLLLFRAMRRHFISNTPSLPPVRITVDRATSLWIVGENQLTEHVAFAKRAVTMEDNDILEVKSPANAELDALELAARLTGKSGTELTQQKIAKRSLGLSALRKLGRPAYIKPEEQRITQDKKLENSFYERESKFDLDRDPRQLLATMPDQISDLHLGPLEEQSWSFRNRHVTVGNATVNIIEKSPDSTFSQSIFQHKTTVQNDQTDQLIRIELSDSSLSNLVTRLGYSEQFTADDSDTLITGVRDRTRRKIICGESGNVFVILADCCTASDNRPPLYQLEVEHLGKIDFSKDSQLDISAVNSDFLAIQNVTRHHFSAQSTIKDSKTTKWDWLE